MRYSQQTISQEDCKAVEEVLLSEWLTQGPRVLEFEELIANYCGASYAVGVNSGTAALHLACICLDVKPEDKVWTSPNSFVASANCALYCGANVDFVDIDESGNLSPEKLEEKLKHWPPPKALVVVHFGGKSCDMEAIKSITDNYGIKIIEDASHALGASYIDNKVGSCRFSDITTFSFHPIKSITTAEGGMLVTNNKNIASQAKSLRHAGFVNGRQHCLGFNYRLNDLQSALGISQMKRLDSFIAQRYQIAQEYEKRLSTIVETPHLDHKSSHHLYVIKTNKRDQLKEAVSGSQVHYFPIHLHPYYKKLGFHQGQFPRAEEHATKCLSIPIYPTLTEKEQSLICKRIEQIL